MEKRERLEYLDTLKLLAISYIFVAHFAATDAQNKVSLFIYALHSIGITGKMCVGILAVIMGFLAYWGKDTDLIRYSVKRYFQFFFCGLFINLMFWFCFHYHLVDSDGTMTFGRMIKNSILLGWEFNPNYWCMQAFLVSSIVSKANRIYKVPIPVMILEIILFAAAWNDLGIWTAVGLLGSILGYLKINREESFEGLISKKKTVPICWLILLALLGIIYVFRDHGQIAYCLYGLMGVCFFLELLADHRLRKIYSAQGWTLLGRKHYMGIFLLHGFLLDALLPRLLGILSGIQYSIRYFMALILLYFIMVLISIPMMNAIKVLTKICTNAFLRLLPTEQSV